jgi:mannan endo-1,4-beta-mannosidase
MREVRRRRCMALLVLGWSIGGCGTEGPDELEAEASACPDRPLAQLGSRPYFVALNSFYLQEEAARAIRRGDSADPVTEEIFAKARALGVPVIRTWGFNDAPEKAGDSAIQIGPLQYDETALRGLDLVLARASARGIQLILPLGNYWNDYGGARQYVAWAGLPRPTEGDPRFFTERTVIELYKQHLRNLLNRINTMDGLRYGDHPAVLAWELLNEPRSRGLDGQGDALRAWIDEIGAHLKSLSPAKPIGTGEEGFESSYMDHFRKNLESNYVDFGSIHYFPETWSVSVDQAARAGAHWIYEHANQARQLGKPLVLGEFGLRNHGHFGLAERRAMYRGWLICAHKTGLAGVAPWVFANDARPDDWDMHTFYFRDGTDPRDPRNRYADLISEAATHP